MILYPALVFCAVACFVMLAMPLWRAHYLPRKIRLRYIAATGVIFFVAASGLYAALGSPQTIALLDDYHKKNDAIRESVERNSELLKREPDNLQAWVELGQAFTEARQWQSAANAFKQAILLSGGNPVLILARAKSLILLHDGTVTDEAKKDMEMALLLVPDSEEARYYLAVRKLQDGNTQEAMRDMKALYHSLPENSPIKAMIDSQIGR